MGDVIQWVGENSGVLYATVVSIVAIWSTKKAWYLKAYETAAELCQRHQEITWEDTKKKLKAAPEEVEEFVAEKSKQLNWGTLKLRSLSSNKAIREDAKRQLDRLEVPDFMKGK